MHATTAGEHAVWPLSVLKEANHAKVRQGERPRRSASPGGRLPPPLRGPRDEWRQGGGTGAALREKWLLLLLLLLKKRGQTHVASKQGRGDVCSGVTKPGCYVVAAVCCWGMNPGLRAQVGWRGAFGGGAECVRRASR
jgi:hypothetical protein